MIKTGNAKEVFLDSEKFLARGSYLIYSASNLNKVRLIFFASLGLCGYHTYSYFFGDEPEFDKVSNTLFASLSAITIAWTSWRLRKTLKSFEILQDGKTFLLKKSTWFGMKEETYSFRHSGIKGVGYWVNKRLRMPFLRVRDEYNNKLDVRIAGRLLTAFSYFSRQRTLSTRTFSDRRYSGTVSRSKTRICMSRSAKLNLKV